MSSQITEEDVAALGAETPSGETLECPECGRPFSSAASLNGHLASHRGKAKGKAQASRQRAGGKAPPSGGLESIARTVVNKAIANTQVVGGFVMLVAPHLGLAIAGLRDAQTQKVIVRSRAEITGGILLSNIAAAQTAEQIQRAAQILELLRRYNSIFEASALGDVVFSLAIAGAVDARLIRPDFKLKVGQLELPVVQATIGDVVAELEREGLYDQPLEEQPLAESQDGQAGPVGAEVVVGGVEAT
jgi:C2H2-type zinc finger